MSTSSVLRTARPIPVRALLYPTGLVANLWLHRDLIRQLTVREIVSRNRGTSLGIGWSVIVPTITLAVYGFVFGVVFHSKWQTGNDAAVTSFVLPMFCGATTFGVFGECVMRAPSLILERPNYVTRIVFPLEVLPLAALGASLAFALINFAILIGAQAAIVGTVSWTIVLFPLVLLPLTMLTLGLAWFFASLGVFVRDVRSLVAVLVSPVLFFLSPVFYPVDQIPEQFRFIIQLNPLTPIIEDARRTLMWGQAPAWAAWMAVTVFSGVVMQLGYAWFMRSKRAFGDVV